MRFLLFAAILLLVPGCLQQALPDGKLGYAEVNFAFDHISIT